MLKNKKGITLVALVVTIVVLLILAGVSINLVLGNNGIIAKAKDAETKSAEASQNDLKGMNGLVSEMEGALAGNGSTGRGNSPLPGRRTGKAVKKGIGRVGRYVGASRQHDTVSGKLSYSSAALVEGGGRPRHAGQGAPLPPASAERG